MAEGLEVWKQVFQELIQEVKPWHRWTLTQDKGLLPNTLQPGWSQYQQWAFARFQCSLCSRSWASSQVKVLFHMHKSKGEPKGNVKMRVFAQRCQKCYQSPFEVPEFTKENISRILNNLVFRILKKCYREGFKSMEEIPTIKEISLEGPHDSNNCEACLQGFCAQSGVGPATQAAVSPALAPISSPTFGTIIPMPSPTVCSTTVDTVNTEAKRGRELPRQGSTEAKRGRELPRQGSTEANRGRELPRQGSTEANRGRELPREGSTEANRGRELLREGSIEANRGRELPREGSTKAKRGRELPREGSTEANRGRELPREGSTEANRGRELPREGSTEANRGRELPREGSTEANRGRELPREGSTEANRGRELPREGSTEAKRGRELPREGSTEANRGKPLPRHWYAGSMQASSLPTQWSPRASTYDHVERQVQVTPWSEGFYSHIAPNPRRRYWNVCCRCVILVIVVVIIIETIQWISP